MKEHAAQFFDNWFDPIEGEVRGRARQSIEELIRGELDAVLARPRYGRGAVPRARLNTPDGQTTEWRSSALRAYQRRTLGLTR